MPCINSEPGPRKTAADAYSNAMRLGPLNFISFARGSLLKIQNINKPVMINPKLLRALTGSLKYPSLILSHQRETDPIE